MYEVDIAMYYLNLKFSKLRSVISDNHSRAANTIDFFIIADITFFTKHIINIVHSFIQYIICMQKS